MVTVDGCSANSDTIQVEVFEQPATTIANVAPQTCVTGSEELELIALPTNGVAPYTYAWISNGLLLANGFYCYVDEYYFGDEWYLHFANY